MTENSNDLDDVSHFLFSPNELNEVLNYEDALQSADESVLNECLPSSSIDGPSQNQTFRLIDDNLSLDPGKTIIIIPILVYFRNIQ